jgi:hypothetical protein
MGNYAFFRGCESRDTLARHVLDAQTGAHGSEPEIEAKYLIPLFWLAGFAPEDLLVRRTYESATSQEPLFEYLAPCTTVREFAARARARRNGLLSIVPAALGDFYDEWIRFVERRYTRCVMIETSDIFSMGDLEESGLRLRGALRALQAADRGGPVRDTAALQWFASCEDLARERPAGEAPDHTAERWRHHLAGTSVLQESGRWLWPARATSAEVAFAASLPESVQHEPGSRAADDAAYTDMVRSGVVRDDARGRLSLAMKQFSGEVPLGVDAPTRGLRKFIGGGGELLAVVRNGLLGLALSVLGGGFIWASWGAPPQWLGIGMGAAMLLLGLWLLRAAWLAQRRFRAILRA